VETNVGEFVEITVGLNVGNEVGFEVGNIVRMDVGLGNIAVGNVVGFPKSKEFAFLKIYV
jgi:hypothetical protein